MNENQYPWWKGRRGEWYVVVQIGLFILLFFGPRRSSGMPEWVSPYLEIGSIAGIALLVTGGLLFISGIVALRRNITPLPFPKDHAELVESGPYRLVRHPIYSGGVIFAFGWALWIHGWFAIGYAIIFLVFFNIKASREEKWLKEKFAGYEEYQKRVKKLVPFVF
jgi:protein-S-isoprenylcysteine O-methyltransferase Ste14